MDEVQPALPDPEFPGRYSGQDFFDAQPIDVGAFTQGTEASRAALARYLVGRAIGESVNRSLLIVALIFAALTGLLVWADSAFGAVVFALITLAVLAMRAILGAVLRRLAGARSRDPMDRQLRSLVRATRRDVLAELRRAGLPSHTVTLPLLAARLASRRRRPETVARLRTFRVDNVVPPGRLDELHLLLRNTTR